MTKELKETTQLVIGMTHREILALMADSGIFCSHDKFTRILQEAQRLALAARDIPALECEGEER